MNVDEFSWKRSMNEVKPRRSLGIYLVLTYMVVSILLLVILFVPIFSDWFFTPTNIAVLPITAIAIIGLWWTKKWGASLTILLSGIRLGPNLHAVGGVLLGVPFPDFWSPVTLFWLIFNIVGLGLNTLVAVYLFTRIFANQFN